MGMTIHYRGKLADLAQVESLEDLLIDLVLELGGQVEVWRSVAEHDPSRVVRGLLEDQARGSSKPWQAETQARRA